jgi:hypothetical protein
MPFEIKVIAEPGSATLCGRCKLRVGKVCAGFNEAFRLFLPILRYGDTKEPYRLSECIQAERRAQEGASE